MPTDEKTVQDSREGESNNHGVAHRNGRSPQFSDWPIFLKGNFLWTKIPWSADDVSHGCCS